MAITIELTPDVEAKLLTEAKARGTDIAGLIGHWIECPPEQASGRESVRPNMTPTEILAYWAEDDTPSVYGRTGEDAETIARRLRREAENSRSCKAMILDTDVLIALEKGDTQAQSWFGALPQTPFVAGYAALELLAGCQKAADRRRIERQLRPFVLLWPDDGARDRAVQDFGALRLQYGLSVLDMLIATTAVFHHETLATFNGRHFQGVPDLVTLRPYVR